MTAREGERWPGGEARFQLPERTESGRQQRIGGPIARARVVNAAACHHRGQSRDPDRVSAGRRAIITRMRREHALSGLSQGRETVRACLVPLEEEEKEEEDDFISPAAAGSDRLAEKSILAYGLCCTTSGRTRQIPVRL